ncbi:phosphoenolpyruvate--protein phosphotransferase [Paenibacillus sp. strain BS8-2]
MEWQGIAASAGYAIGRAHVLEERTVIVARRQLAAHEIEGEVTRLSQAAERASLEVQAIRSQAAAAGKDEQAAIFATHLSLLVDPEYMGEAIERIRQETLNAEAALQDVTDELVDLFGSLDNPLLQERCADLRDIQSRLLAQLRGESGPALVFAEPVILIGNDITPSVTAQLDRAHVLGFALETGGTTSHSAIIARSAGIPAVAGLQHLLAGVSTGDLVILDGYSGTILVHPNAEQLDKYRKLAQADHEQKERYAAFKDRPSLTADGHSVQLAINIAAPKEASNAAKVGAQGIGLFRSEFLFMNRNESPSEEEQFEAYKTAALAVKPGDPIIIRTLDAGGDKDVPYLQQTREDNPFLGYRAIRLCLNEAYIPMFKQQLRAILRASAFGNVKLMYPMISTLQELRDANRLLQEAKDELDILGGSYRSDMEVGVMIEVPAAALIADKLAKEVHFFSIGTNDLVQYTMAADRMNKQVAYLSEPLNPAVLRLIQLVITAAHQEGRWVGMCGEMAGQLSAIPILLGLGLDEFSMSPSMVLPARELISRLHKGEMQALAQQVLQLDTAQEIEQYVRERVALS